jgi:hypothetical protein
MFPDCFSAKMPLQQSRSHSASENDTAASASFKLAKRLRRKLSTTCTTVPDIVTPKDQQRRVTVLGAGMCLQDFHNI